MGVESILRSNALIAEFMDVVETPCYVTLNGKKNPYMRMTIPGLDEEVKYFKFRNLDFNDYTCLQFHDSWDWLMPVVRKCYVVDAQLFTHCGLWDFLLQTDDKLKVWRAVIKFIKTNKDEQNQRSNPR
jgi:hypothetical protein